MTKTDVNNLIKNMTKAGIVSKASPWSMEAVGDLEYHVRYVGLRVLKDWAEIFSLSNNLLIKFAISRQTFKAELLLANKPPFVKISSLKFTTNTKWEVMLGEVKMKLKKDKADFLKHTDAIDNLYAKIKNSLK